MRQLALAMLPDDPSRPSLTTLKTWVNLRPCAFCKTAAMRKSAEPAVHPPVLHHPDINNGEGLHIDCLGTNPTQTIDGSTDMIGFILLEQSAPSEMTWQDSNASRKQ
jgi:hypothetical protein